MQLLGWTLSIFCFVWAMFGVFLMVRGTIKIDLTSVALVVTLVGVFFLMQWQLHSI